MRKQYDITNLQRHLDAIVWTYSVSPRSDSSTTYPETHLEFNSGLDSHSDSDSDSDIQITGDNSTSHPPQVAQPMSTSQQYNRWTPTTSEADSETVTVTVTIDYPM